MEKHYLIPKPLLDAVVQYLSNRPWAEVHEAMGPLLNLQEVDSPAPPSSDR